MRVAVRVTDGRAPLREVEIAAGAVRVLTDDQGLAHLRLRSGVVTLVARRLGYLPDSLRLILRDGADTLVTFVLGARIAVVAPVIVSSTRAERRVEEEPLRVEVLSGEDVAEKTLMRPADIRSLVSEMSGVRVQTTSPALGAATIRLFGLRGRYSRILTDGLPLYGAPGGSFGLLQIPPLDLRQAEVIKGAASALYGPGALGGVLDLISRRPPDSSEALVNVTARGGSDVAVFAAHGSRSLGGTLLGGVHVQPVADVDGDGWSDVPGLQRVEVRPRLFASSGGGRSFMATAGLFAETRGGGRSGSALRPAFPESLSTRHVDAGAVARAPLGPHTALTARVAANAQARSRRFGGQRERERSHTLFGEAASTSVGGVHAFIAGLAGEYATYRNLDVPRFDEVRTTASTFVQYTLTPVASVALQVNGRCDATSFAGTVCTTRGSVLGRWWDALSIRLSGGSGWDAPAAVTEQTDVIGLTRVAAPLAPRAERARTASLDATWVRGPLQVGGTAFSTRVRDPVGLRRVTGALPGEVRFVNADGPSSTHGGELFVVYTQEPVLLTAFYAATRSRETDPDAGQIRESPYVPRSQGAVDLAVEEDETGTRVGVELFYTGAQAVEENPYRTVAPAFATVGLLASQRVGAATMFVNLENLTNVRQTRYDPLGRAVAGEGGRLTVDAWGPLEGRSLNAGVRVRL